MTTLVFNDEQLTRESIQAACARMAENDRSCIVDVLMGVTVVNDPDRYVAGLVDSRARWLRGEFRVSFAFCQLAYYLQTGKDVAFLP